ncbi:MarR family winged helix-turn-helix transcriptional regulator [Myceligenerans indicum]|uniref:MarR family transcriptional regulator n=1 Tax=Myceligenerans indicum TaxID=2593663 RepID=A0ABS1LQW3_9MICO|nr:MarR family transcriptional regulator [Myceligenerans indicum]MBL0887912.1 MarR family transcriptional regulator [Myceligenerans indicum]
MKHTEPAECAATTVGTDELIDALTQLGRRQRVAAERMARELGWPRAGLSVLRMLGCSGPASLSDIAAALEVDVSVASRQVGALVDAGYVVRTIDPEDRRIRTIAITDSGRALVVRSREQFGQIAARAFATWSDDDIAAAVTQLRRLSEAIGAPEDLSPHQNVSRN